MTKTEMIDPTEVSHTDTQVNLPPEGFYFVTKHTSDNNIPVVFFALQQDGTGDTVSIRVNPQEIETNPPTMNSIMKLLVDMWEKEYGNSAPTGPDVNDFVDYKTPTTEPSGEMV